MWVSENGMIGTVGTPGKTVRAEAVIVAFPERGERFPAHTVGDAPAARKGAPAQETVVA